MENEQPTSVSVHQQHLITPIDEANEVRSNNDIMTRRLKNRERQRRYRARKRLEAERNRDQTSQVLEFRGNNTHTPVYLPQDSHIVSQRKNAGSSTQAIDIPIIDTPQNFASRVHCRRDWKKDARRAHLDKQQKAGGEKQLPSFNTQVNADPSVVTEAQPDNNDGTRRAVHSRRHWKAEARNKKS